MHHSSQNMKYFLYTFISAVLTFPLFTGVQGQNSGFLTGRVTENTGSTLPGANVFIAGTTIGTISDTEGRFTLNNLEPGEYTVGVSFLGYEEILQEILIQPGRNDLDFELVPMSFSVEAVVVTALYKGQQKAINQQVNAETLVNVVSEDRIKELPDVNAAESIGRLPGVSVTRSGGEGTNIVIRGLQPQLNAVTVNGMRLPSTALDTRTTGLGMISSELLSGIEVYKVPTPDMDAEAIGGTVNLTMKKAPKDFGGTVKLSQITNYLARDPFNYKASVQIGDRFFDDRFGVIAQANAEHINRSTHTVFSNYQYDSEEAPYQPKSTSVRYYLREQYIERYGGSINLDYNHGFGSISLFSFANLSITNFWEEGINFSDNNTLNYDITEREVRNVILNNALTGNFEFPGFSIDYAGSWSQSNREDPLYYSLNFQDLSANYDDIGWEVFTYTPEYVQDLVSRTSYDSLYLFKGQFRQNPTTEQNAIGKIDVKVPIHIKRYNNLSGFIKFGSSIKTTIRSSERILDDAYNIYYLEEEARGIVRDWGDRNGSVMTDADSRFFMGNLFDIENMNTTKIGDGILVGDMEPILDRSFTNLLGDIAKNYSYRDKREAGNNYNTRETVLGSYVMLNFDIGRKLNLIAGLRHEFSDNTYEGIYSNLSGPIKDLRGPFYDTLATSSYHFLLPHLHLRYKIFDWFDIRFSSARTLSRPSYNALVPSYSFSLQNTHIDAGNPDLRSYVSDNLDVTASFYSSRYGMIRVGGFYKRITDPYYSSRIILYNDSVAHAYGFDPYYKGWELQTYFNGPEAKVWGYEIELQTSLRNFQALPKFIQGIILSLNMSRLYNDWQVQTVVTESSSVLDPITGLISTTYTQDIFYRKTALSSLVPMTFNGVIGYDYKGFMCRLTANYQSDAINSIGNKDDGKADVYTKSAFRLDFSAKQDIGKRVSVTLNIANITSEREREYLYEPQWIRRDYHYGITSEIGVRIKL